jgi:carbon storage regulator
MLILTRKPYEEIVIGANICMKVLRIMGKRVQLGFTAPEGVRIVRAEIRDRIPVGTAKNRVGAVTQSARAG